MFKLANTQLQRALNYFIVDGWVTEHVRLLQDLSKCYKQLAYIESSEENLDPKRVLALHERRIKTLEPIHG